MSKGTVCYGASIARYSEEPSAEIHDSDETWQGGVPLESKKKILLSTTTLFLMSFVSFENSFLVKICALRASQHPKCLKALW